jgi:galactokinase
MQAPHASLKEEFKAVFGPGAGKIHIVRAPGRVNLIGEHTDYNDGFVFPMAIEPEVQIACRGREDGLVRLASTAFAERISEFSINRPIEKAPPQDWTNYPRGVVAGLIAAGIPITGMDALISNTLPVGGGLSSSAAIEVGTARALLAMVNRTIDEKRLALLCQKAEHEYAGAPVGIMDQTIVTSARAGHAMLLDCRDLSKQYIPLDANELRVVIANSMVKHELSGGEYAKRRRECEIGVAHFRQADPSIKALRDVTIKQLESAKNELAEVVYRRCRHVITENARTSEFASRLTDRMYERAGELMVASHESLRDDYNVSTIELDFLVEQAMTVKGVYGARMTGGGFGGCIVALAQPRASEMLMRHLESSYQQKFGKAPKAFTTTATAGASVVE